MTLLRFRLLVVSASVLGIGAGGTLGAVLGGASSSTWGDLIGVIMGVWLGGPVAAFIIYQLLLNALGVKVREGLARMINFVMTVFSAILVLGVLSIMARSAAPLLMTIFLVIAGNALGAYAAASLPIRISRT